MILDFQIFSFLFCIIFGFVYGLLFKFLKSYFIYSKFSILWCILFNFVMFFLGIVNINFGVCHIYFLLFFGFGCLLAMNVFRHL